MPKILQLLSKKLDEVEFIVADLKIIGLVYKEYKIHDAQLLRARGYLGRGVGTAFSMGGLAAAYYTKNYKKTIKAELNIEERAMLRKYYYKQRIETWELFPEQVKAEDVISIDFNHLHLNLLKRLLPIKRMNTKELITTEELP
jgi:hypothetical protein